jgi:hypothetical protein
VVSVTGLCTLTEVTIPYLKLFCQKDKHDAINCLNKNVTKLKVVKDGDVKKSVVLYILTSFSISIIKILVQFEDIILTLERVNVL